MNMFKWAISRKHQAEKDLKNDAFSRGYEDAARLWQEHQRVYIPTDRECQRASIYPEHYYDGWKTFVCDNTKKKALGKVDNGGKTANVS